MNDAPLAPPELEPGPVSDAPLARRKGSADLRSARWFGPADLRSFGHRSRAMQMGVRAGGMDRQAGDRDPEHLVRPAALPRAFQAARG